MKTGTFCFILFQSFEYSFSFRLSEWFYRDEDIWVFSRDDGKRLRVQKNLLTLLAVFIPEGCAIYIKQNAFQTGSGFLPYG